MKLEYEPIYIEKGEDLDPYEVIDLYKKGYEYFYEIETFCDFRMYLATNKKVTQAKIEEIYEKDMEKEFAKEDKLNNTIKIQKDN